MNSAHVLPKLVRVLLQLLLESPLNNLDLVLVNKQVRLIKELNDKGHGLVEADEQLARGRITS